LISLAIDSSWETFFYLAWQLGADGREAAAHLGSSQLSLYNFLHPLSANEVYRKKKIIW
jgi:hypothetical protein